MSQHYILDVEHSKLPMLTLQIQKKKISGADYVNVYKGLKLMSSNGNLPMSRYRITNRKGAFEIMSQAQLIMECGDKKKVISEYVLHEDTKYYVIAPKGFEFMRAFEYMEGLL